MWSKSRSTLHKKVKKFLDSGEGSGMRTFTKPHEIAEFHRLARGVSARTYQERLLDAGIPDDERQLIVCGNAERVWNISA